MRNIFCTALLFSAAAAFAAEANWPQFRGPGASGIGTGTPVTEWDAATGKNILWKSAIP